MTTLEPLEPGVKVKYGFTVGLILRAEKGPQGIPGYIVQDLDSANGYGADRRGAPRWVPASSVTQMSDEPTCGVVNLDHHEMSCVHKADHSGHPHRAKDWFEWAD